MRNILAYCSKITKIFQVDRIRGRHCILPKRKWFYMLPRYLLSQLLIRNCNVQSNKLREHSVTHTCETCCRTKYHKHSRGMYVTERVNACFQRSRHYTLLCFHRCQFASIFRIYVYTFDFAHSAIEARILIHAPATH